MERQRCINKEQLSELLKKYKIGKKPLSKLLGWGETTVLLYSSMDSIPDNEYTERLYDIYEDKGLYLDILLKNRENITKVAFKKSLKAIHEALIKSDILIISQYIFDLNKQYISLPHLDVILFWSQIVSLVFNDKPLFEDFYQPSKGNGNSPYRSVAEAYKEKQFFFISDEHEVNEMESNLGENYSARINSILTEDVRLIVNHISDMFSWYGERAFQAILASERYKICGPANSKIRRTASNDMLKKIYGSIFEQARIKKPEDIDSFIAKRIDILRRKKAE